MLPTSDMMGMSDTLPESSAEGRALTTRLRLAIEAARAAGALQRAQYQQAFSIQQKSTALDLVTSVDLACDALIRERLQAGERREQLAAAHLITEETFEEGQVLALESAWVVDPLDGTTNFAHGFPHFTVSIAYVVHGRVMLAVVYDPLRDELFSAVRGQPAYRVQGEHPPQALSVSRTPTLDLALLATGFPYDVQTSPQDNMGLFLAFMNRCHGVRRAGSAALDLAYVAAGRLEGFWEMRLSPWDVAAGMLLVEAAGGLIADLAGKPLVLGQRRIDILAANHPAMAEAMIAVCARPEAFYPVRYGQIARS